MSLGKQIKVWCPVDEDEPLRPNAPLRDVDNIACRYAERRWHEDPHCPVTYRIHVRTQNGQLYRFDIDVLCEPEFYPRRVDEAR